MTITEISSAIQPCPVIEVQNQVTARAVIEMTAGFAGVAVEDLLGHCREERFVTPRHVAMHLIRKHCGYSYPQIARIFGDRNHTTILKADQRVAAMIQRERNA